MSSTNPQEAEFLFQEVSKRQAKLAHLLRKTKLSKLKTLIENQINLHQTRVSKTQPDFAPAVINLSPVNLSTNKLTLLSKGQKFAVPPIAKRDQIKTVILVNLADLANGL
mgnify:CR=1 FL=1